MNHTDVAALVAAHRNAVASMDPKSHEARAAWIQAARLAFPHTPFCWGAHDDNMIAALRRRGVAV